MRAWWKGREHLAVAIAAGIGLPTSMPVAITAATIARQPTKFPRKDLWGVWGGMCVCVCVCV